MTLLHLFNDFVIDLRKLSWQWNKTPKYYVHKVNHLHLASGMTNPLVAWSSVSKASRLVFVIGLYISPLMHVSIMKEVIISQKFIARFQRMIKVAVSMNDIIKIWGEMDYGVFVWVQKLSSLVYKRPKIMWRNPIKPVELLSSSVY